jgi:hypothetical protein
MVGVCKALVLPLVRCKARFVPVEGNGTEWFGGTSFKFIVNANGEVVGHHVPT